MVISTRRQALDLPFSGIRISLLPLGDDEQLGMARAMRGEEGERLVDHLQESHPQKRALFKKVSTKELVLACLLRCVAAVGSRQSLTFLAI